MRKDANAANLIGAQQANIIPSYKKKKMEKHKESRTKIAWYLKDIDN